MLLYPRSREPMPSRVHWVVFSRRGPTPPHQIRPAQCCRTRGSDPIWCRLTSPHHFPSQAVSWVFANLMATAATEVGIVMRPTGPTGYPSSPPDASSAQIQYSFTYTFNPNGTFATSLSGPLSGTFLAGPRSGQTFSIPDLPQFLGVPSQDFSTIVLAEPAPMVETVTYSNGDVWPRICHRSHVLIRIGQ